MMNQNNTDKFLVKKFKKEKAHSPKLLKSRSKFRNLGFKSQYVGHNQTPNGPHILFSLDFFKEFIIFMFHFLNYTLIFTQVYV